MSSRSIHRQQYLNQSKSFANLTEREKEFKVESICKEVVLDDEKLNGKWLLFFDFLGPEVKENFGRAGKSACQGTGTLPTKIRGQDLSRSNLSSAHSSHFQVWCPSLASETSSEAPWEGFKTKGLGLLQPHSSIHSFLLPLHITYVFQEAVSSNSKAVFILPSYMIVFLTILKIHSKQG